VAAEAAALVAIQMDCFVVPLRGTSRNDILQAHLSPPDPRFSPLDTVNIAPV
jgi:hypothetical protein